MKAAARSESVSVSTGGQRSLLYTLYFIYFFCGLTQCFEGVFLPEFKEIFQLSYQQQMYTMAAKNIPFVFAGGIGYLTRFGGYKICMTAALALFAGGTFLLVAGLRCGRYEIVLLGFFLIGLGFNAEIVAGNPMLTALGPARNASSRLNLGNALGAVAQILAPATLSLIIPATAVSPEAKLPYINGLFLTLGVVLALISVYCHFAPDIRIGATSRACSTPEGSVWSNRRVRLGLIAVFVVLGIEAGLFGFYRNYLQDPSIAGLSAHESQLWFTAFFTLFALGRLLASWVQTRILPTTHLVFSLVAAIICVVIAVITKGMLAVAAVTVLGFFASVLFPTIYSLAVEGMGERTGQASGVITMGFLGCAVIPVLQGKLADLIGLQYSYALGVPLYVLAFGCVVKMRAPSAPRETTKL